MSYLPALPDPLEAYHANGAIPYDFVSQIRDTMRGCVRDIENVSRKTQEIQAQGGWEAFWSKGKNINALAEHMGLLASVQQKSLDMTVLLMSAAAKMKGRYDIILESIEDLSHSQAGKVEVLDYLVKVKTMVSDLKERDELLDSLLTYTNDLRRSLEAVEDLLNSTVDDFTRARGDLTQSQEKAAQRLERLQNSERELEKKLGSLKGQLTAMDSRLQKSVEQVACIHQSLSGEVTQLRKQGAEGEERLRELLQKQAESQAENLRSVLKQLDQAERAASDRAQQQDEQVDELRSLICDETAALRVRQEQFSQELQNGHEEVAQLRDQTATAEGKLTQSLNACSASQTTFEKEIARLRRQTVWLWAAAAGGWVISLAALLHSLR